MLLVLLVLAGPRLAGWLLNMREGLLVQFHLLLPTPLVVTHLVLNQPGQVGMNFAASA